MTPEQQALYDTALRMAYALSTGLPVNQHTPKAREFIAAARAAAAADGGKTLREAAEAV